MMAIDENIKDQKPNMTLINMLQKPLNYHQVRLTSMRTLQVKKCYFLIKAE